MSPGSKRSRFFSRKGRALTVSRAGYGDRTGHPRIGNVAGLLQPHIADFARYRQRNVEIPQPIPHIDEAQRRIWPLKNRVRIPNADIHSSALPGPSLGVRDLRGRFPHFRPARRESLP